MAKLVDARVGGAQVTVETAPSALTAAVKLPGAHTEEGDVAQIAQAFPRLNVPKPERFSLMGDPMSRTVALEELVLHPGVLDTASEVMSYLRDDLPGDEGLQMLNITGATGNGKTTFATAIAEEARAEGFHVLQVDANSWLSRDRHTAAGKLRDTLMSFARQVSEGVAFGQPAKGVIVINEAHVALGDNPTDDEAANRAAAFNNIVDELSSHFDGKIVVALTSRFPLISDVASRAAWTVEMANPNQGQRGEVLHRLLMKQVDQETRTSAKLDDEVLKAVLEFGTMDEARETEIREYLTDRNRKVIQEPDPELVWAEKFFGLVGVTEGFAFRDMGTLIKQALFSVRRGDRQVSFDDLYAVAKRLRVDVMRRAEQEEAERARAGR